MRGHLVGSCEHCGQPAHLRCTVCGRTICRACLDEEERICVECTTLSKRREGAPTGHPPSRKTRPHPHAHPKLREP